jgi:hypothetical protein
MLTNIKQCGNINSNYKINSNLKQNMDDGDLKKIKQLLDNAENQIRQTKSILFGSEIKKNAKDLDISEENVIEGVFDGENMIASNEKKYPVPANYASKSKLIPGDILKLTILPDGGFLFKQIGPTERKKIVGELEEISDGKFMVNSEGKQYRVLLASVTYFKAESGDKLTIIVPEKENSEWAAVENLFEKKI